MNAYRMTYHSQKNGTIQIVTMGRDMIDAQTQAAGWARATNLAFEEESELVGITKLACKRAEFDPQVGKAAQKKRKPAASPRKRASRIPAEYRVDFARAKDAFACQECGQQFQSGRAAEKAQQSGCPGCGGTDVDLA